MQGVEEDTGITPKALLNRPKLTGGQSYFNEIFHDLTSSRGYSQTGVPLPIPLTEFNAYFEIFHIKLVTERQLILKMIQAMDRKFIEFLSDKASKASETDSKPKPAVSK